MANNILITPASASIQFSGSAANTIRLVVEDSGSVAFYGDSGSLFGISDSLSGSLMSVNDISGFPILEVTSDDTVTMGTWNQNTLVVTGSNVGIGTATPTQKLSVSGDVGVSGTLSIANTGSTNNELIRMTSGSNTGSFHVGGGSFWMTGQNTQLRFSVAGYNGAQVVWDGISLYPNANGEDDLGYDTNYRWRTLYTTNVSASGDVSASTFTGDGSNVTGVVSSSHAVTADSASYIDGLISFPNGLDVTGSLLVDGDISASGTITGSAFFGDGANITGIVSAQTASYIDGFVNFDQGIVVTGSLIASGGLSGIGEPNPSYDLDVNGIVRADAYYWDTAAPQQTPSDSRLKTKVTPLPPQSDRIRDVNLVEFEWSELNDTRPSRQNRTKRQGTKDVGVIAQEIQEIFPELVSEDVDGYLTVSYVGLLIPLIKTVQEQQKQIDELKKLISGEE